MSGIKRFLSLLFVLYCAYLLKTALGINLSQTYSAPTVFKIPLKTIDRTVKIKKIYRHARTKPAVLNTQDEKKAPKEIS
ncbi:MAG: hypothetical protein IGR93_14605 [Hydrococcus sp. C42_A2020_068]|uniref:hypothetical protein n=1 Tax=Pleurocapsa sp. PCC 7327 TaxID=118163 RepID=UPI00029FCE02|nr:hypothetical protein [Pleurocapsa sp. PCC 7327]AFY79720.1 hypothetical protein Ple7327_4626 [Pleurocapsa sp. PCC 7327]MBF2021293.1 hypothetical protein [Hydrococcus sp. C42_A2020_068]